MTSIAPEDLLQSALVKVASKWPALDVAGIESYIRKVIYREHVTWWRRAGRRGETLTAVPPESASPDNTAAVDLRLSGSSTSPAGCVPALPTGVAGIEPAWPWRSLLSSRW